MERLEALKEVSGQVALCERCELHFSRKNAVPGEGPVDSEIMFIGEGPGFFENEQGRPFVGQAGKLLEDLLVNNGLKREQVFITNVVKCRPPGNRDPLPAELTACGDFLDQQIAVIDPRVIVTLGRYSMARFLPGVKISDIHGQSAWVHNRLIVPMYHPAAALHQPSLKPQLEKDFSKIPGFIEQARRNGNATQPAAGNEKTAGPDKPLDDPTQLKLF